MTAQEFAKRMTPKLNPYIKQKPHPKQALFLLLNCLEALYGGAAGGGKSSALLAAALQYVDIPGYNALLLRRNYADLAQPGALMDRAHDWLQGKAKWNEKDKRWTFSSGATVTFGYMETDNDRYRYQGAEYQFIGSDELTQFTEVQYLYLFSRLRKIKGIDCPLRVRSASNPGGAGHEWVKRRFFLEGRSKGRIFVPAGLSDNPSLDEAEYTAVLNELDPVTRMQLLSGNWDVTQSGGKFQRSYFDGKTRKRKEIEGVNFVSVVRAWDFASTEPNEQNKDPDWTASVKMGLTASGILWILDARRVRATPGDVEKFVKETAEEDGTLVPIFIEQEPGSSGKTVIDHYRREVLREYAVRGVRSTGGKDIRANPFASACYEGDVFLIAGPWNAGYLDELEGFSAKSQMHDDWVDASSLCFSKICGKREFSIGTEDTYNLQSAPEARSLVTGVEGGDLAKIIESTRTRTFLQEIGIG